MRGRWPCRRWNGGYGAGFVERQDALAEVRRLRCALRLPVEDSTAIVPLQSGYLLQDQKLPLFPAR